MADINDRGSGFSQQPSSPSEGAGGRLGEALRQGAQQVGSTVASQATEAWDTTRRQAQELASRAASQAEDAFSELTRFIRRHPVPSILVALGLGIAVAGSLKFLGED